MELNHAYDTYNNLASYAPVAALVAGLITVIVLFVITLCCCNKNGYTRFAFHGLKIVYAG